MSICVNYNSIFSEFLDEMQPLATPSEFIYSISERKSVSIPKASSICDVGRILKTVVRCS